MKNFKVFLSEEFQALLILEAKADEFANRWIKLYADHQLVKSNPELARQMMKHAFTLGQKPEEHDYIIRQYLNGILKPKEDDPTIRDTLGMWRKMVDRNLHGGKKLSDYDHDSIQKLFTGFPELRKTKKKSGVVTELAPYHIGKIEHPEYGTLDVYHIHKDNVKDEKEYEIFRKAMKTSCTIPGSTVCVQHNADHVKDYSRGHGFFAYLDDKGTFRLGHGFEDRGIVRHNNEVLEPHEDEHRLVADQTERLIKNKGHKVIYQIAVDSPHVTDADFVDSIEDKRVLKKVIDSANMGNRLLSPAVVDRILSSDTLDSASKTKTLKYVSEDLMNRNYVHDDPSTHGLESFSTHESKPSTRDYANVVANPRIVDTLVEKGQGHVLFSSIDPWTGKKFFGLERPEDYKKKILDAFVSWNPKDLQKEYKEQIKTGHRRHDRESDMMEYLHSHPERFTVDDFERLISHPNFSHAHGMVAAQIAHNITVGSRKDDPRISKLMEKSLQTKSTPLHAFVMQWAGQERSEIKHLMTPENVSKVLKDAKESDPIFFQDRDAHGRNLNAGGFSRTMVSDIKNSGMIANEIINRLMRVSDPNNMISSIIKSGSVGAVRELFSPTNSAQYTDELRKHLTEEETDILVKHPDGEMKSFGLRSKNLSEKTLNDLLTKRGDPQTAELLMLNRHDSLKPEHYERIWDTHKQDISQLYNTELRPANYGNNPYKSMFNVLFKTQDKNEPIPERIVNEAVQIKDPMIHHAVVSGGYLKKPEHVHSILDSVFSYKEPHPDPTQDVMELSIKMHTLNELLGSQTERGISNVLQPDHLRKISDNIFDFFAKHRNGSSSGRPVFQTPEIKNSIIKNLYSHPNMPIDILDKTIQGIHSETSTPGYLLKPMSDEMLERLSFGDTIKQTAERNPNLSDKTIDEILKSSRERFERLKPKEGPFSYKRDNDPFAHILNIAANPGIKGKHLDELVSQIDDYRDFRNKSYSDYDKVFSEVLKSNTNLEDRHINQLLAPLIKEPQENAGVLTFRQQSVPSNSLENIISNKPVLERLSGDTVKSLIDESIKRHSTSQDTIHDALLRHPNLTSDHIKSIVEADLSKDKSSSNFMQRNPDFGMRLLLNPNNSQENITKILEHMTQANAYMRDALKSPGSSRLPHWESENRAKQTSSFVKNILDPSSVFVPSEESSRGVRKPLLLGHSDERNRVRASLDELNGLRSKITPEHIDMLYDRGIKSVGSYRRLREDQKKRFIDDFEAEYKAKDSELDEKDWTNSNVIRHHNISNTPILRSMLSDSNLEPHHVERIFNLASPHIADSDRLTSEATHHPNLSPELIKAKLKEKLPSRAFNPLFGAAMDRKIHTPEELSDVLHSHVSNPDIKVPDKISILGAVAILEPDLLQPRHYVSVRSTGSGPHLGHQVHNLFPKESKISPELVQGILNHPDVHHEIKQSLVKILHERQT